MMVRGENVDDVAAWGFMDSEHKFGYVAVVGRPNAGKSTFVNRLVGQKVAIVTSRPQTTRNRIQGIVNRPGAQVVLIDTPGLHRPDSALGRQMMGEIDAALDGIDALAAIVDASEEFGQDHRRALARVATFAGTRILLLNKIDRLAKHELLPIIEATGRLGIFSEIIPIAAATGDGCEHALETFVRYVPEGSPRFPPDQYTDQPERFLAGEIVREKAMLATHQEVPHAVAVLVDSFEESDKLIRIHCTIYVEREGQKGILIGSRGGALKQIGTLARKELEEILGVKIFLELHVKVQSNWRDNPQLVRQIDWHVQLSRLGDE
jgi:GTP-binding protein Era